MTTSGQRPLVALACGGTGGHVFPGLAVAAELTRAGCEVMLFVSAKEVDQRAVRNAPGMEVVTLPAVGLRRGGRLAFLRAFRQSYQLSKKCFSNRTPCAALAMGSFTSAPPILAARKFAAPVFLHESNTIPGRANRWLSWLVDGAFVGFPSAGSKLHARHVIHTGTPVRSQFQTSLEQAACRAAFGFDPARDIILVMGGSQGASGINELVVRALPLLARASPRLQWLHLAGAHDLEPLRQAYRSSKLDAVVQPFCDAMESALGAATVALSRAGASSLAELAAMRVPAILFPYPFATDNHQLHNARAFEQTGAARLFSQPAVEPEALAATLMELTADPALRERMRLALAAWHTPHAAEQIAQAMLKAVNERQRGGLVAAGSCASRHHRSSALA